MSSFVDRVKDLVFLTEENCYLCRENYAENFICPDCYEEIVVVDKKYEKDIENIDEIYVSTFYNRYIKEKVMDFKFHDKVFLYQPFGKIMVDTLKNIGYEDIDLIIPIPIYKDRMNDRGYNQSELLAKYIGDSLNIAYDFNIIEKIRNTKPQSTLELLDRRKNLEKSFSIKNTEGLKDKKILLVDDVITTGTTIKEVGKLFKNTGVKSISCMILSSTDV